jgi:hypothetical protein
MKPCSSMATLIAALLLMTLQRGADGSELVLEGST